MRTPAEEPVRNGQRSGRPRDPDVDRRIMEAVMDLFATAGWGGLSIDAVAREAGVGKASVYLRWDSKEELLTDAIAANFTPIAEIDEGNVRGDLIALATILIELYEGRHGLAARRMAVESRCTPGIAERWDNVRISQVTASRAIVRRAIKRGELPARTPVTLLLDALCGAAMNRSAATPEHLRAQADAARGKYVEELVTFVLDAARAARAEDVGVQE